MEHPENNDKYKGLAVNAGIEQPSLVNPYLKKRKRIKRTELSVSDYVEGITKGNITILSRAVTLIESVLPEHQSLAQEVIEKCLPYSGNSMRIGISGVPGAGKSTSIDVFGTHVLEYRLLVEKKIGRYLTNDEIVHHINGDQTDNRLENLEVMTLSEHAKIHAIDRRDSETGRFVKRKAA